MLHGMHELAPAAENEPAWHGGHSDAEPLKRPAVPAAHGVQSVEPVDT